MNLFKNRFFTNTGWLVGGKAFQMLINFLISMLTFRYLGPENYGVLSYALAFVTFFSPLCTLGINTILVNELKNDPEHEGQIIGSSIVMRFASSLVSIILIRVLIEVFNPDKQITIIVTLLQSFLLLFQFYEVYYYWYQSRMQSKKSTIIQSIAYIFVAGYKLILILLQKDVTWFAFSNALDFILISLFFIFAYKSDKGQKLKFSLEISKRILKKSYHFILSGFMVAVFVQTDKIMIKEMMDETAVGLYSAAMTICSIFGFVPVAIIDAARPLVIEQKGIDEALYVKRVRQFYAGIIWVSLAFGVLVTVFARTIILVTSGSEFLGAQSALVIVVWYCSFSYLGSAKNIWLICEGLQRYEKWFTLMGAFTNVALNFILIPIWGINGAAVATLVTQIAANFIYPSFVRSTRPSSKLMFEAFFIRDVVDWQTIKALFKTKKEKV